VTRRGLYPVPWLYRYGMVLLLLGAVLVAVGLAEVLRAVGVQ
jgi:hypothetical protein